MTLQELIERLKKEDTTRKIPIGFCNPHSYRGCYNELAFEIEFNTDIYRLLASAEYAVDEEFEGWKGGMFKMSTRTNCHLVADKSATGIEIDEALLERLLANYDIASKVGCSQSVTDEPTHYEKSGYVLAMRLLQSDLDLDGVEMGAIAQFTSPEVMRRVLRRRSDAHA